jgi:superfamily II DNA or RNA helicase
MSYDIYNACKLGKASNIPDRDSQYATGEIKRGYFELVFEVSGEMMSYIESSLQTEFQHLNIVYDAGKEFYDKKIIELIEPYMIRKGIAYTKLSDREIGKLVRCNRPRKPSYKYYTPREDQSIIVDKSIGHFQVYDKGMLILICGVGKTLISLWIAQRLNSKTILIGVPNKLLLKQWGNVICKVFNRPLLIVSGGKTVECVIQFLKDNMSKCIIITTYSSAYKVRNAVKEIKYKFDLKILDEAHHLTTHNMLDNQDKKYIQMLEILSDKQLSLTATVKYIENPTYGVISNDNVEYFGDVIDRKCLYWAINEGIVCDYVIQTIVTDEDKLEQQLSTFNIIEENDKRLFLSAYSSLKSINDGHSHHLLIYLNSQDNSIKLIRYLDILLENGYFSIPELFYSYYNSKMTSENQKVVIDKFKKATYGILTCVYCLGEGWDLPLLDGVVFAENMTSNIRIVQSALRACRKYDKDINKKAKIILPILNKIDWLDDEGNQDLKKVREVIYQMGLEDISIYQKIKVYMIGVEKHSPKKDKPPEIYNEIYDYDEKLTQKLRLKTTKRIALSITYQHAIKIIAEHNIKSKEDYYKLCERDNRLSNEPEIAYKGQFTNWIEYLSIERVFYDIETCRKKVSDYLTLYPEIKAEYMNLSVITCKLCEIDKSFPPNELWCEYYGIKSLDEIISVINTKKKIGVIL